MKVPKGCKNIDGGVNQVRCYVLQHCCQINKLRRSDISQTGVQSPSMMFYKKSHRDGRIQTGVQTPSMMLYKKSHRDGRIQTGVSTPGRVFYYTINPEGVTELYISDLWLLSLSHLRRLFCI